jgi:hypothetical protein
VSFPEFAETVRTALRTNWGRDDFDHLVNNAGHGHFNPIATVTEDEFDGLFNVHLKGPFFLTQALLPLIADGGQIVNLTSATTRVTTMGVAPYASFKGGLEVLTRYMAKEFGDRRIRSNSISPGPIRTELGGGLNDEFEAALATQTALGRVGEPEDVGTVIASLLSEENGWITPSRSRWPADSSSEERRWSPGPGRIQHRVRLQELAALSAHGNSAGADAASAAVVPAARTALAAGPVMIDRDAGERECLGARATRVRRSLPGLDAVLRVGLRSVRVRDCAGSGQIGTVDPERVRAGIHLG